MSKIKADSTVTMHFSIYLADGSVADSTQVNDKPGVVTLGDGTLPPAFEAQLQGLTVGDKKRFILEAKDAFGESNPEQIRELPLSRFPEKMVPKPGLIVEFTLPSGDALPGMIKTVNDEHATVDFNHLLAGKQCTFEVEILEINAHSV